MRQSREVKGQTSDSNGTHPQNGSYERYPDVFDHDMELDDHDHVDQVKLLDTNSLDGAAEQSQKYQDLLQEAIEYGQVLMKEFRGDKKREQVLNDTFSLIEYEDPKQSRMAHLLDVSERIPVAEQLNGAILGK
jgi:Ran-binding protein 9/10